MLRPIPDLADYGMAADSGFLPSEPPLRRLPPAYDAWEDILADLHPLLLSKRVRPAVDRLPLLSTDHLHSIREWRRAYVVLVFLLHAYVWGGKVPEERVPRSLSIPLLQVSEHLDLPPVATYAGVCLWNYRPLYPDEPADNLSNMAALNTFTGSLDEQWFYLVSIAIEARGAPSLQLMLDAVRAARCNKADRVTECLQQLAVIVSELGDLLQEMYTNCHPHAFYHGFRPYLAGSRNMADAGLPRGVLYEDGSGKEEYRQYGGGSAAQSSLIQFFDIVLGIEHRPTGESASDNPPPSSPSSTTNDDGEGPRRRHNFIMDMRTYMPGPHRRFLEHVASVANLHEFVQAHPDNTDLRTAYNACLAMVRSLRQKHIQMVTRYIVVKSRESRQQSTPSLGSRPANTGADSEEGGEGGVVNLSTVKNNPQTETKKLRGTGGTALIEFLKQARDETSEPALGSWATRILNSSSTTTPTLTAGERAERECRNVAPLPKIDEHADGKMKVVGLAGSWSLEPTEGGLCHW